MAGRTGADAVFVALRAICGTLTRYRVKLDALINAAVTATVLTPAQGTVARDFVASANAACTVFQILAEFNSILP